MKASREDSQTQKAKSNLNDVVWKQLEMPFKQGGLGKFQAKLSYHCSHPTQKAPHVWKLPAVVGLCWRLYYQTLIR